MQFTDGILECLSGRRRLMILPCCFFFCCCLILPERCMDSDMGGGNERLCWLCTSYVVREKVCGFKLLFRRVAILENVFVIFSYIRYIRNIRNIHDIPFLPFLPYIPSLPYIPYLPTYIPIPAISNLTAPVIVIPNLSGQSIDSCPLASSSRSTQISNAIAHEPPPYVRIYFRYSFLHALGPPPPLCHVLINASPYL